MVSYRKQVAIVAESIHCIVQEDNTSMQINLYLY